MNVFEAYRLAWQRRALVVPVLLAVRLLSIAVIAPLVGLAVQLAISLSGQSALTDQDIAAFILSPVGFPVFLIVAGLLLIGSVIGLAVMTVDLHDTEAHGLRAIVPALRKIAMRFPSLMRFAVEFVLRVLLIVAPFAAVVLLLVHWQLGDYDINYYLSARPPEFLAVLAIGAPILAVLAFVLLGRVLGWALSLHFVLFGAYSARAAFAASRTAMDGARTDLLRELAVWFAVRAVLTALIGGAFGWMLRIGPGALGSDIGAHLAIALVLVGLWWLSGIVLAAVSLGALARLLDARYAGPEKAPVATSDRLPRLITPGVVTLATAGLLTFGLYTGASLVNRISGDQEVLVIGHRGAAASRPENTLASIRAAVEDGADWVEIDVQETADGEVVVIHDSDFMKLADMDLKIWDATVDDLSGIDIGSWFSPDYAAERVPTLAQALEVTRDRAVLLIELKYYGHDEDLEARMTAIVEAAGLADQVAVMSLKYPAVQKMMALRPDWPVGVLAATAVGDLTGLDGEFIAVNAAMIGPRLVRQARNQGKKLFAWTVNDPMAMSAMISMGVDGLITDEPALARDVIAHRASLDAPERLFLLLLERFNLISTDQDLP